MKYILARFALGLCFGFTFLVSFQIFRLTNWLVGGMMVMMLFGTLMTIIMSLRAPARTVTPAVIDRHSLAIALAEIVNEVQVGHTVDSATVFMILEKHFIGQKEA